MSIEHKQKCGKCLVINVLDVFCQSVAPLINSTTAACSYTLFKVFQGLSFNVSHGDYI